MSHSIQGLEKLNVELTLRVALLPSLIRPLTPSTVSPRGAVVIDTLRFTTTAAQALQAGAKSIRVLQDVDEARATKPAGSPAVLLCGERHCRPIDGFDLGNSPLEYQSNVVDGKSLVFSTTNGTLAVGAAADFEPCLLAALVNRSAVASAMLNSTINDWTIVCAGTDGEVAGEDVLAAGAIAQILVSQPNRKITLANDSARLALDLWLDAWSSPSLELFALLETFSGGYNLVQSGYKDDIRFAAQVDVVHCVPARRTDGQFSALS